MVNIYIFSFYKKKRYRYEDELGFEIIQQLFPNNSARKLVGIS